MKKLTDGRRTPSDGNTSHDPLVLVSEVGFLLTSMFCIQVFPGITLILVSEVGFLLTSMSCIQVFPGITLILVSEVGF
jgi:hypothetical protein